MGKITLRKSIKFSFLSLASHRCRLFLSFPLCFSFFVMFLYLYKAESYFTFLFLSLCQPKRERMVQKGDGSYVTKVWEINILCTWINGILAHDTLKWTEYQCVLRKRFTAPKNDDENRKKGEREKRKKHAMGSRQHWLKYCTFFFFLLH